jgi:hypothetical protein
LTQGIKCGPIEIVVGYNTDHLAIEAVHDTVAGSTKFDGTAGDRIENGLNVCR